MLVILVSEIVTKKRSHFWQEFLYSVQNYEIIGIEKAKKTAIRVLCFLLTVVNEVLRYENQNQNQNQNENETLTLRNAGATKRSGAPTKTKTKTGTGTGTGTGTKTKTKTKTKTGTGTLTFFARNKGVRRCGGIDYLLLTPYSLLLIKSYLCLRLARCSRYLAF